MLPACATPEGGQAADGGGWWDVGLADSLPDGVTAEPCKKDKDCKTNWQCLAVPGQGGANFCIPPGGCNPGPEFCNGADDDCDGQIDNAALCDDGNVCNGSEQCSAGACAAATQGLDCSDGDGCTADSCDPLLGCKNGPLAEPLTCDDGDACTGCDLPAGVGRIYAASAAKGCPEEAAVGCNALWMPGFFDGNEQHVVRFGLGACRSNAVAYG